MNPGQSWSAADAQWLSRTKLEWLSLSPLPSPRMKVFGGTSIWHPEFVLSVPTRGSNIPARLLSCNATVGWGKVGGEEPPKPPNSQQLSLATLNLIIGLLQALLTSTKARERATKRQVVKFQRRQQRDACVLINWRTIRGVWCI